MRTILLLTLTQLKSQFSMSGQSRKEIIFKYIFDLLKFVGITAVIFVAFYLLSAFRWVSLDGSIPVEVLAILMTLMLSLSLITCVAKVTDTLYFSKDNSILLTIPATKTQLFTSKMLQFLVYELIKNIYFFIPLFVSYGAINSYPVGYYFWIILCWFLFTLLIVSIGGLLSIPYMLVNMQMKRYFWLKILLAVVVLALIIIGIVKLIMILPENFDLVATWGKTYWKIQDFLSDFAQKVFIITALCKLVVGSKVGDAVSIFNEDTFITLLFSILAILVVFGASIVIIRMLFFKMASYPFEHRASASRLKKENIKLPPFVSFIKKEGLITIRTPHRINSLILFSILTPMAIFLMNRIYLTMNVRLVGKFMIYAFNVLMITLLCTSSSASVSTNLSEEGNCFYITKINPNKYIKSLLPKMIINFVVMTISLAITIVVFTTNVGLKMIDGMLLFVLIEILYTSHLIWSAELDIMNPQYKSYQENVNVINNPNEVKSTIYAFIISLVVALFVFVNLNERITNYYTVWIKLILFAIAFLIYRIYMYKSHIELYFKEK